MESPNLSESSGSDLTLPSEHGGFNEHDHLSSSRSTWKSRRDCVQAYFCYLMNFTHALQLGASIGRYGFLVFIPYIILNIFVGIPAVLVELMMSRYVMSDLSEAWNMCPLARGVLWILLGTTIAAISNNLAYLAYLMKYFFESFTDRLKWSTCNTTWSTINCYVVGKKTFAITNCLKNHSENFCMSLSWETSGTQFWKYSVADKTSVAVGVSFVICELASIFFIVILIFKEIRSFEKMFILLVNFPIILGVILVWVTFSAPEALIGLRNIFKFNWNWLLYPQIWIEALEHTLLYLGLGDLSLTLISSHGEFTDDIFVDVVIVIFGGFLFSLFLMVPILCVSAGARGRHMIDENYHLKLFTDDSSSSTLTRGDTEFPGDRKVENQSIRSIRFESKYANDLIAGEATAKSRIFVLRYFGKEDVIISMSDALTLYPFPNTLWSALTYLNWFLIASSTQAILVLSACDVFVGMLKFDFFCTMITLLALTFFMTLCFMFFNLEFTLDLGSIALITIVLFTITWQLFYGMHRFNYDFFFMLGHPLPFYMKFSWYTLSVLILTALAYKLYLGIPDKPLKYIGYCYIGIPCLVYFIAFISEITVLQYKKEKISHVLMANPNWGPENALLRKSRNILASGKVNREFMYRQELNKKPFQKPINFAEQNIVQLI